MKPIKITITYCDLLLEIESKELEFRYNLIEGIYKDGDAVGLQWKKEGDNPKLLKQLNSIADVIKEIVKEGESK